MRSVFSYNKRDELYMHILEHKYDIVGLSENGLMIIYQIANYIFLDIAYTGKIGIINLKVMGGGVALYINEKLFQDTMRYYLIQSVKLYGLKYPLVRILI